MAFLCCSASWSVSVAVLLLALSSVGEGGKLVVVPQDWGHWLKIRPVVQELKQRGHEIIVVVAETNVLVGASGDYTLKTYSVPYTKEELNANMSTLDNPVFTEQSVVEKFFAGWRESAFWFEMMHSNCRYFLQDQEVIRYLEDSQVDAFLIDAVSLCGQIVAEYLSKPSLSYIRAIPCSYHYEAVRCPNPKSYVPRFFSSNSDHMDFFQRVYNMLVSFYQDLYLCRLFFSPFVHLASEFLQKPVTSRDLFSRTSIWLLDYDFVFEFPQPSMPNMAFIGGVTCAVKQPLSLVPLYPPSGIVPSTLFDSQHAHEKGENCGWIYEALCAGEPEGHLIRRKGAGAQVLPLALQ